LSFSLLINYCKKPLAVESQSNFGESHKSYRPNMHAIEYYSDSSDDETKDCFVAKFV
jgi:hypothetical protein